MADRAVHMTCSSTRGHAQIYRALHLPKSWTEAQDRCADAGVPDKAKFATTPYLSTR